MCCWKMLEGAWMRQGEEGGVLEKSVNYLPGESVPPPLQGFNVQLGGGAQHLLFISEVPDLSVH